jgi:nucleoside-diphosphate-sugar epimerase
MKALLNVLETGRLCKLDRIFVPSSIAVFGSDVCKVDTPQTACLNPGTVYGISKVAAENWGMYYFNRYGLDVRSLRYPGVISYQSMPGGGTTDYAVDIFHHAVQGLPYTCFLKHDTRLPMIYIDDAINATLRLMEADALKIKTRTAYNLAGLSFTPAEITKAIQAFYPEFASNYAPDLRQQIADTWPESIDDSEAKQDWGWKPEYNLSQIVNEMILKLGKRYLNPA